MSWAPLGEGGGGTHSGWVLCVWVTVPFSLGQSSLWTVPTSRVSCSGQCWTLMLGPCVFSGPHPSLGTEVTVPHIVLPSWIPLISTKLPSTAPPPNLIPLKADSTQCTKELSPTLTGPSTRSGAWSSVT